MKRIVIAALLLSGCATAPTVYEFPSGLRIVRSDQFVLSQACADQEGHWDDGTIRRKGEAGIGCWDGANNTIYVDDSCAGAKAIVHEMAHKEGIADPDNAGYDWK